MTTPHEPMFELPDAPDPSPTMTGGTLAPSGAMFAFPGASVGTTQWKVDEIQLVNWGGFDAPVTITFDPDSTLLSGASGSGKSTLLDAYTAVMMPSDVPFNGASNDTAGRARGAEQRSVVSYVRGQTDITTDNDGDARAQVLRGHTGAAWGGIAVVFVDDHGKRFTATRLYYVPATARLGGDVTLRMLTLDGHLTLRDLEPLAADQFPPQKLRALVPGLNTHDTYQSFAARLHTRLGIGANGDGDKALRLLAKVQAGTQIRTVDALYKDMVLERPATFTKADKALASFDHLADIYRTMEAEHRKAKILEPITGHWADLTQARETLARHELLDLNGTRPTPVGLWADSCEADLLTTAEADAQRAHTTAQAIKTAADSAEQSAKLRLDEAREEYNRAGGGDLAALDTAIEQAGHDITVRSDKLAELNKKVAVLLDGDGVDLTDRAQFDALQTEGAQVTANLDGERRALATRLGEVTFARRLLKTERDEEDAERERLVASKTRITLRMQEMRRAVCERAGLAVAEAPFLAELVAVREDEREWTIAVEKVLGAVASRMLVPDDRLDAFQRAVNDLKIHGELRFDGAVMGLPDQPLEPANTTAGKLEFAPSPYRGWAMRRVAQAAYNAVCVADPTDLGAGGYRVTRTGQTRNGRAGSLGRRTEQNILGFTNEDLIASCERRIAALDQQIQDHTKKLERVDRQMTDLNARHSAFVFLSATSFEAIDVPEARAREKAKREARDHVLAGNDALQRLKDDLDRLEREYAGAVKAAGAAHTHAQEARQAWEAYVKRRDILIDQLDQLGRSHPDLLTDQVAAYLDVQYAYVCADADPGDLDAFPGRLATMRRNLLDAQSRAQVGEKRAITALESVFDLFLTQFPVETLSPSIGAYHDFARMLEEIQTVGLHERRATWRQTVMEWSGEDLFPLAQEMDAALDDIDARLAPINDILRRLPFGPTDARLQMRMRKLRRDHVTDFRRKLKDLSSGATVPTTDQQMDARFRDLEAFMARLRSAKDPSYDARRSQRDDLLDVRRHVEVLAERQDQSGAVEATYSSLQFKSGGEVQELIAFIVGAALRFRLGDEERERPRFAPVFLDEGFIKADPQFASRAVLAWVGLGFQLIVGAPIDKYAALEPHMAQFFLIAKNQETKKSHIRPISDRERAAARHQGR